MMYNLTKNQQGLARWIAEEHSEERLSETFVVSFLSNESPGIFVDGERHLSGHQKEVDFGQVTVGSFEALANDKLLSVKPAAPRDVQQGNTLRMGLETIRVTILGTLEIAVNSNFVNDEKAFPHVAAAQANTDRRPDRFETASETYTVQKQIGEGGAGIVFEVSDSSGNTYALKCLKPDNAQTTKRKRFKNELKFSKTHPHRNLIPVIDDGAVLWRGQVVPFYVTPYMPMTLRKLLDENLSPEKRLHLFNQILSGVEAAHLLSVVHRDLKPENILYDPTEDRVVVADFGIAQFADEHMATLHETKVGELLGNRNYLAPEQRKPGSVVDHRADIFALGLILNELFTGQVPYGHAYRTIGSVAPSLGYLDAIIERMIHSDPSSRYSDAGTVKNELIARGNQFVIRQRLDAKNREVVPTQIAERVPPIKVTGLDWDRGILIIQLDREPEEPWKGSFWNVNLGGRTVPDGLLPRAYQFSGATAKVGVNEATRQNAVDQFKLYAQLATEGYQARLDREAQEREEAARSQLFREAREEEIRLKMLKDLTF